MVGGAEETGEGTGEAGAGGSPVCSAIGDRSPRGLSLVRVKMEGSRPSPPSINSKGGLTAAAMLQSRLGREPNVLKHLT